MTRIACVLRSGGEFKVEHVRRLRDQCGFFAPDVQFVALSDVLIPGVETIPLEFGFPGWWSKLELFRPDVVGDLLYFDLDSLIVGDLYDMLSQGRTTLMRDVYRPEGLQSSVMFLAYRDKEEVWTSFRMHSQDWMQRYRREGDQGFLERFWLKWAARWQDVLPGQVVSWKADCVPRGSVPRPARVVAFHGKPRPWEVGF